MRALESPRRAFSLRPMANLSARIYAWLGAAVFGSSLAYFAYFFTVELGRPVVGAVSTTSALRAWIVNALLFAVFAIHHSVMARDRAKQWLSRFVPGRLDRATYVWVASLLFAALCRLWRSIPGVLYETSGVWAWCGRAAQLAGVALIFWAVSVLDVWDLAGVRQVAGAGSGAGLRLAGPYRLVRHPIYLGWILVVFGTPQMTHSRFAFAVISVAYLVLAIPWEERSMMAAFGERYREYLAAVRWRMVPGIY